MHPFYLYLRTERLKGGGLASDMLKERRLMMSLSHSFTPPSLEPVTSRSPVENMSLMVSVWAFTMRVMVRLFHT